jgi:hypothetical protein
LVRTWLGTLLAGGAIVAAGIGSVLYVFLSGDDGQAGLATVLYPLVALLVGILVELLVRGVWKDRDLFSGP